MYRPMSLCPVHAPILENLDLETPFSVHGYIFGISRSWSSIKVIGLRSRSRSQESKGQISVTTHISFVDGGVQEQAQDVLVPPLL